MIISVTNQKGGVGKTTTAINLGACLASKGKAVLIVDMDPQANASLGLGINVYDLPATMYDVMISSVPISAIVRSTMLDKLHVAPAHLDMSSCDIRLASELDKPFILRNALSAVRDEYEYIIVDSPPALNVLTINSLVAADYLIIPIESKYYALAGMSKLNETVANIKKKLGHNIELLGVLITIHDSRTNVHQAVYEEIKAYFGEKVFDTVIRRNIALSEAEMAGVPIVIHDVNSHGAEDYSRLTEEVLLIERQSTRASRSRGNAVRRTAAVGR